MQRLHAKGCIYDPVGKAKSVVAAGLTDMSKIKHSTIRTEGVPVVA